MAQKLASRWLWLASQVARRIWFRAALFSLLAVVTALLGIALSPYIPSDLPTKIGSDAVDHILSIIASSMLAVTTFSLSVMVAAYSAASTVSPRATTLVIEDSTTQNVLSTFVGSFLFSLVGIIVLSTGAYGVQGRVVLFVVTIVVVVLIVATLLRWIDHLSRLGRVPETTALVEHAAAKAMRQRHDRPFLGGSELDSSIRIPALARPIYTDEIGYVQHVDVSALAEVIAKGGTIYLGVLPGDFVDPSRVIAWTLDAHSDEIEPSVRKCISISDTRSFDQDPRFGLSVLAEIASRALSPGINDPGTAIDVVGRAVRVLAIWAEPSDVSAPEYPGVMVRPLELADMFDDLFIPVARDGASMLEIGLRLQKAFVSLSNFGPPAFKTEASRHSAEAVEHAEIALKTSREKSLLRAAADRVQQP